MTGGATNIGMMSLGFSMLNIYKLNTDNAFEHEQSCNMLQFLMPLTMAFFYLNKPATEVRWLYEPGALI